MRQPVLVMLQNQMSATHTAATPEAKPVVQDVTPSRTRVAIAWLLLLIPLVAVALSFWPGRMNADTLVEIYQVRFGGYTDQHAPVLQSLWHVVYDSGVGPGYILIGQVFCFIVGAYLVLRLVFRPIGAAVATVLIALSPPVFGMLGLVGRDMWFVAGLVLMLGAVASIVRFTGRRRLVALVVALLAGWVALAARQNAAAGVVVAAVLLVGAWRTCGVATSGRAPRRDRRFVLGSIALGVLLTLGLMATQIAYKASLLDVAEAYPSAQLYMYDLGAMSRDDNANYFPKSITKDRSEGFAKTYTNDDSMVPLLAGENHPITYPVTKADAAALGKAWRDRITGDPLAYVSERLRLFFRQIALTRPALQTYHPWIDQNPFGYSTRWTGINGTASDYLDAFADDGYNGGIVYRVWLYLLVCIAGAVVFLRRWTWGAVILGGVGVAALTYQVGIFFGPMGTNYRFEFPTVVLGELMLAALIGLALTLRRSRGATATAAPARAEA
jgi:hypothetical protein